MHFNKKCVKTGGAVRVLEVEIELYIINVMLSVLTEKMKMVG